MQVKGGAVLKVSLSVLIISFLVYQIYSMVYKPITTATAVYYETYSGIEINGYFVRDEQVLSHNSTGAERYIIGEGEKVAKGGTVAEIYSSAETVAAYEQAAALEEQINTLQAINSVTDPSAVDINTLTNRIERAYIELIESAQGNSFHDINGKLSDLLIHLNRKQMLTGDVSNFDSLLTTLNTQLSSIKQGLPAPVSTVTAESSGFFVTKTDGLENILTVDALEGMDATIFDTIAAAKPGDAFGKIVSPRDFYIIALMEGDDYLQFAEGDKLQLKTSIPGSEELKATVHKINVSPQDNSALVVLYCNTINGQIATVRRASMTIVTESYSGIRISKNSVRVVDGVTGVYTVQGSSVKFRPVEIIYSTDTYSIVKMGEEGDNDTVRLYDEVIERGKNLYDGKYIG